MPKEYSTPALLFLADDGPTGSWKSCEREFWEAGFFPMLDRKDRQQCVHLLLRREHADTQFPVTAAYSYASNPTRFKMTLQSPPDKFAA